MQWGDQGEWAKSKREICSWEIKVTKEGTWMDGCFNRQGGGEWERPATNAVVGWKGQNKKGSWRRQRSSRLLCGEKERESWLRGSARLCSLFSWTYRAIRLILIRWVWIYRKQQCMKEWAYTWLQNYIWLMRETVSSSVGKPSGGWWKEEWRAN